MDGLHAAFVGRLGGDADRRFLANGTTLLSCSVLVQDSRAADGQGQWVRVGKFGDEEIDELTRQLVKGSEVYIEGKLRLKTWTANDGSARSGLDCTAWRLEPIGAIGRRGVRSRRRPDNELPDNEEAA